MTFITGSELKTDYSIDQVILDQNFKITILNFIYHPAVNYTKKKMASLKITKKNRKNTEVYIIDSQKVKEFNFMYEIKTCFDSIFFFNNRKIFIDSGTGDNNKVNKILLGKKKFKKIAKSTYENCMKGKNFLSI